MRPILFIALRMLTGDRPKFLGLVLGLAFASFLMAQQIGIFMGFVEACGVWVRQVGRQVDVWVVDPETEMVDDLKQMRNSELERVRSVPGVAFAVPMYKNYAQARLPDGSVYLVRIIGIDDATLIGGPPNMAEGRMEDLRNDQAVIIDADLPAGELLMKKADPPRQVKVGDRLDIFDHSVRIVGTYRKEREFFWGTPVYTTFRRAQAVLPPLRKNTTFILVKAQPGTDPAALCASIRAQTGLGAHTTDQMAWMTTRFVLFKTGILISFGSTALLGCLIGVLISAQLFWSFVHDNLRFFGMLKAVGATQRAMALMVLAQGLLVAVCGMGLGIGLAALLGMAMKGAGLALVLNGPVLAAVAAGVLACTSGAGLLSFWRIARVEPGIVFRS